MTDSVTQSIVDMIRREEVVMSNVLRPYQDQIEAAREVGTAIACPYLLIGNGPLHPVAVDNKYRLWACQKREKPNGVPELVYTMIADFSGSFGPDDIVSDNRPMTPFGETDI